MRRRAVLAATAAAFCAGSVVAIAADSDEVITACVSTDGDIRIPVPDRPCAAEYETTLTWNATGPVGPAGSPGPKGDAGATGAKGDAGTAGPAVADLDSADAFDPTDLSGADRKALERDAKGPGKVKDQKAVSGKVTAIASCVPESGYPGAPSGACRPRVRVVDYLSCPVGFRRLADHSVAAFPAGYPTGNDAGQGVPDKPPFAGWYFDQGLEIDGKAAVAGVGRLAGGKPFTLPKIRAVTVPKLFPSSLGPAYTFVREPGYAPVSQTFGLKTFITCEREPAKAKRKGGR